MASGVGMQLVQERDRRERTFALSVLCLSALVATLGLAELVLLFTAARPIDWEWIAISAGIVLVVGLVPVSLAGWARARRRRESTRVFRLSLALLAAAVLPILTDIGLDSPERAVRRAQPLVDAIRRHIAEQGAAPKRLQDLVPKYLAEVPDGFTRTFHLAQYERDAERAGGFTLVISGVAGMSSQWLDYDPDRAVRSSSVTYDRSRPAHRIGDWVWNESTL